MGEPTWEEVVAQAADVALERGRARCDIDELHRRFEAWSARVVLAGLLRRGGG